MAGKNAGRSGSNYRRLRENQKAKRLPCWICGQRINYEARDPNADDAFSYDHYLPLSTHPELAEEPENGRSAHQKCNKARGNRPDKPGLGRTSRAW